MNESNRNLIVGISGASGAILGIRLLEVCRQLKVITHLVLTLAAHTTINYETDWNVDNIRALAHYTYDIDDIGAQVASGSFVSAGMVVIPCSIKTLSAIANSYSANLLARAADVTLKEGQPLVLVVREAPLHRGHLRLMRIAAEAGAVIFPPVPAFYSQPESLEMVIDNIVGRVLKRVGIDNQLYIQWKRSQNG